MISYFVSIPITDLQLRIKAMVNEYSDELIYFCPFHIQFNTLQRRLGVRYSIIKCGLECHGSNTFISDLDGLRNHCCHAKHMLETHLPSNIYCKAI